MIFADEVLDRLAPAHAWVPDWPNVLTRAGEPNPPRLVSKRRFVMVVAVLAAVLVPLAALAAANDWWFLRFGGTPVPTKAPQVVKEGEWDGHPWQLIAYPSGGGLCVSMTPTGSVREGEGAAMGCSPLAGASDSRERNASPDMTITYLSGSASRYLPAYIVGPVIETASAVEIRFSDGEVLRVPTFAGPESLKHIHFYAARLRTSAAMPPSTPPRWIAGLDANGNVVACLAPLTAKDGNSPLSDCR